MIVILVLTRRIADAPVEERPQLDLVGAVLSALGLGAARLRRAALRRVGLDPAEARRPVVGGPLADGLARARRAVRDLALLPLGGAPRVARPGAARPPGDAAQPAADRRPDDVLLPVPGAGGLLLRRAALPLGRARPVRDRRPASGCCRSRSRCSPPRSASRASCRTSRRGSSSASACSRCSPARVVLLGALDADAGAGDRLRADAARRARHRRARLAARRRHRLGRARRREPRGRRRPEHDDEPRRLARHRARRLDADRHADVGVPREHPAEPRRSRRARRSRRRSSSPAASPFVSDADLEAALDEAGVAPATTDAALDAYGDARLDGPRARRSRSSPCSPIVALFLAQRIPTRPRVGARRRKE